MDSKRKNICVSYRTKLTLKFCSGLTIRTFPILGSHHNVPRLRRSNESYIPNSYFLDHQFLASKIISSEERGRTVPPASTMNLYNLFCGRVPEQLHDLILPDLIGQYGRIDESKPDFDYSGVSCPSKGAGHEPLYPDQT